MGHLEYTASSKYIIITILLLLLLTPILSSAAQPRNETSQTRTGPTPEEKEKMDEILKKLEEEDRKHPPCFHTRAQCICGQCNRDS